MNFHIQVTCNHSDSMCVWCDIISCCTFMKFLQRVTAISWSMRRTRIARSVQWLCYGLDNLRFSSWQGQEIFYFSKTTSLPLGLTSLLFRGNWDFLSDSICQLGHLASSFSMALQPGWALASFTIRLQASRSLALSLHSFIPIFLSSVDTSSNHLIFGLPLRLVAYSFPYIIFFGIAVSCILSIWPSHRILWHFINLTMFSPLIIASNSSFCRILHNSFSFTGP